MNKTLNYLSFFKILNHSDGFKILDRASTNEKLEYEEMFYIRKSKSTINKQEDSQIFTLVIRTQQLDKDITRNAER